MSLRARLLISLFFLVVAAVAVAWLVSPWVALVVMGPIVIWLADRVSRSVETRLQPLDDGLRAFLEGDFTMRVAAQGDDRIAQVLTLYNANAQMLRTQRSDVFQTELLLDTILQRTPVAVVLVSANDRVVYANAAARDMFDSRLEGHLFEETVRKLAPEVRDAVMSGGDAIVSVSVEGREETFHLSQRTFRLNTIEHRLVLVERLTAELRRQEIAVWKNAIRVINHELNNTIAPISSMIHSARIAQERPDRRHHLTDIYETIEERLAFLREFLESYAQFARLPAPRKERTRWQAILDDVHALYAFRVEGNAQKEALVDPAQMQQLVINLVKNAHEAGGDANEVVVSLEHTADACVLRVLDRGHGMTDEVMRKAFLPFYSTKPRGSGMGLALCNEIVEAHGGYMRLQAREGGGTTVTCYLPL